jgi:hypothetical protein
MPASCERVAARVVVFLRGQLCLQHGRKGGKAGKGKPKGGKTAKGVKRAPYKCGVIQTPQELLLAFQQEFSSRD